MLGSDGPALSTGETPARERPAFFAGIVVFAGLGLILPAVAVDFGSVTGDGTNIVLAYLITLYCAAMLARICYRGGGRIVRAAFFIFCYVFMGISVFAQIATNTFPLHLPGTGAYTDGDIRRALAAVILSIVAFEAGAIIVRVSRLGSRRSGANPVAPGVRWRLSEGRVLALGIIGLLLTALLIERAGIRPFFSSRQAAGNAIFGNSSNAAVYSANNKASKALLHILGQIPILIALFSMLYMKHHKLWRRGDALRYALTPVVLTLLIVANLIVNNPISNSRFWFGTVGIALASIYVPISKAKGIRWAAILAVVTLLFAFTSLQAFRRNGGAQEYSTGFRNDLVTSGTYSEFTMELIGQRWLEQHPHTKGRQLAGAALIFVPRSIWTGKPVDTGNLVVPYANPAASLWTEGDVEAGWIGIAGYFLVLGAGAAYLDRRLRRSPPGSLAHAAIPIVGGFSIFVLRGSLLSVFGPAYVLTAAFLFAVRRHRVAAPAAADDADALSRPLAVREAVPAKAN